MIRMIYGVSMRSRQDPPKHATFSVSSEDRQRIEELRVRLGQRGHLLNRSEVVRLSLLTLHAQSDTAIDSLVEQLRRRRPGRVPKKLERR